MPLRPHRRLRNSSHFSAVFLKALASHLVLLPEFGRGEHTSVHFLAPLIDIAVCQITSVVVAGFWPVGRATQMSNIVSSTPLSPSSQSIQQSIDPTISAQLQERQRSDPVLRSLSSSLRSPSGDGYLLMFSPYIRHPLRRSYGCPSYWPSPPSIALCRRLWKTGPIHER